MKRLIAIVGLTLLASPAFADPQSEISAYRKSHGLSAATVDSKLTELAGKQVNAMDTLALQQRCRAGSPPAITGWLTGCHGVRRISPSRIP
jgi:hypothetical protein